MLTVEVLLRSFYCHKFFKKCNRKKRFFSAIEKVELDVRNQLNIISVMRRFRMHGFAIH